MLKSPDFKKFELHTDISDKAVGGVLVQEEYLVALESWELKEAE